MSLNELDLRLSYRSSENNIDEDFFSRCIKESVAYDRAVGYFSSNSLKLIAKSLLYFFKKNGKIRIITSINLETKDIEAIVNGILKKEEIIKETMLNEWNELLDNLDQNILDIFSWMIATERLEIKIAINKNIQGLYHEKFGIFKDENNNKVAFIGSANETAGGFTLNFESIDVFCSYEGGRDLERALEKEQDFEKLWNNTTEKVEVMYFDKALKNILYEKTSEEIKENIRKLIKNQENNFAFPEEIKLRPYQNEAYQKWIENNGRGILNMATGTGKTLTALSIMSKVNERVIKKSQKICYIVVCPQIQLVNQWKEDILKLYKGKILICNSENSDWDIELKKNLNYLKYSAINNLIVLTTNTTFISDKFQEKLEEEIKLNTMLIIDECHNIGSQKFKNNYEKLENISLKLGLSATPKRYNDIEGNLIIEKILGEEIFSFGLKEAIEKGYLTEYYYYPVYVTFNLSEENEYIKLSKKILKLELMLKNEKYNNKKLKENLDLLKYKRTRLIQNLESKKIECLKLLSKKDKKESSHNLIYAGAGKNKNDEKHIDVLLKEIRKIKSVEKFTSEENSEERKEIIKKFSSGEYSSLLAIKCLDEGINIPEIKRAIILSSTSNPKEYIQRRGRILRKSENKEYAEIYDFIVIPRRILKELEYYSEINIKLEKNLIDKELRRVEEYLELANNKIEIELELLKLKEKLTI